MRKLASATTILLLAGCGGGASEDTTYSKAATESCLQSANVETSEVGDAIAEGASGGFVRAEVDSKEVHIVFGTDSGEVDGIEESYDGFGLSETYSKRNAVIAWTDEPTDNERDVVDNCVR